MEDGILAKGPPSTGNIMGEDPSIEAVVVSFLVARQVNLVIGGPRKPKSLNRLVAGQTDEVGSPPGGRACLGSECCPVNHQSLAFNKRDTSVADMCELYPTNLGIPVMAFSKEYSIPFPQLLISAQKVLF